MKLFVRPASLPDERRRLTELLSRNLPELDHDLRFDWMYVSRPAGRARAWFVCDEDDDRIVGAASVFPEFVWIDGEPRVCIQVGDFAVDPSHRSLGPALMLQRATLGPVDDGEFAYCYDCPPHDRGMATFQRLGLSPVCRMERLARLLNADETIEQRIPGGPLVRAPVTVAVNCLLGALDALRRTPKGLAVARQEGDFGEEFSSFDEELARSERGAVRARRHADDLNWRFRADPLNEYDVLTARRGGDLLGFVVYRCGNGRARVVDLLAGSNEVLGALLRAAAEEARRAGAATIDLLAVSGSHEASIARGARFLRRSAAERVVVYPGEGVRSVLANGAAWALTASDIMV